MNSLEAAGDPSEADGDAIRLDQFLKLCGVTETGGQAKHLIQDGQVKVNGVVETRRRRKLAQGDLVEALGERWICDRDEDAE